MAIYSINVAKQFSETPAGRYRSDGPTSGEVFREDLLYPALQTNEIVEVNLDGTLGYGSSFLEEVFGGLIREKNMSKELLVKKLKIISSRKFYEERIWKYITDAEKVKKK